MEGMIQKFIDFKLMKEYPKNPGKCQERKQKLETGECPSK